jgi:hypothetical protein
MIGIQIRTTRRLYVLPKRIISIKLTNTEIQSELY